MKINSIITSISLGILICAGVVLMALLEHIKDQTVYWALIIILSIVVVLLGQLALQVSIDTVQEQLEDISERLDKKDEQ